MIAGGAQGISASVASYFLLKEKENEILLIDKNAEALDTFCKTLPGSAESRITPICLDLTDPSAEASIQELLQKKTFDHLVLVNGARYESQAGLEKESLYKWREGMEVMSWVPLMLGRLVILDARRRDVTGSIVNLSSVAATLITPQPPSYHMAKAALDAATRYLAIWAAKAKVRLNVNSISLGLIIQDRHIARFNAEENELYRQTCKQYLPGGVPGSDKDVCQLVAFLTSPDALFLTGTTIPLDGGASVQEQLELLMRAKFSGT